MSTFRLGVIGLGYVGLPLARAFAERGHDVHGIDIDQRKISQLRNRVSYLSDLSNADIGRLFDTERFRAASSFDAVASADAILICVPTPLDRDDRPDLKPLLGAVRGIVPFLRKGQLVVLESSTFPGTCEELVIPLLESAGMVVGRDLHLAYSPERIDPGSKWTLESIPKVIGGFSPACTAFAKRIYDTVFDRTVVVSSLKAAEMTKLLENAQRFVNISLMNSLLPFAREMNIDLWEVIDAAGTKPFGFSAYYPGVGVGGHCIPVDPLYLLWKAKEHQLDLPFIELSHRINREMPAYTVGRVKESMRSGDINGSRILAVGVTYKKDVNDLRESASMKVVSLLRRGGAEVSFYDPYVEEVRVDGSSLPFVPLTEDNLKAFDCVLILTDHSNVPYDFIATHASAVLDTRNVFPRQENRNNIIHL